jgi:hypothetical protein
VPITAAPPNGPNGYPVDPNFFVLQREDGRVVYHLGAPQNLPNDDDATKSYNWGPYTVGNFQVPAHWWNARWTDRTNCPIKIVKSPQDLVKARRAFPMGFAGVTPGAQPPRAPYSLMGSSCIMIAEPTTGDRPDLGQITGFDAGYLMGGDPTPMIDWALACESEPKFFRDAATDQIIDLNTYPNTNSYDSPGANGSPWLAKGPPRTGETFSRYGGNWQVDQNHKPSLSAVAYWATQDLGFLENLQYEANYMFLALAFNSGGKRIISGNYRGIAWSLNLLFSAHTATADAEASLAAAGKPWPKWLKPSSYFKSLLDDQLAYFSTAMTNTAPANAVFHLILPGAPAAQAPWQADYMLWSLAFGILTGHSDWSTLYLWALKNLIDRFSGTSGWPPAWDAYYIDASQPSWAAAFTAQSDPNNPVNVQEGVGAPTSAQLAALQADPFNGGVSIKGGYTPTHQAAMVAAQYLDSQGILAVRQTYPNLNACAAALNKMVVNYGYMEPEHSLVNDPTQAPSTIVPYKP